MAFRSSGFVVEVVGGEDHGARLDVTANVSTIGRARDADLVLRDVGVSRRHVQATVTGDAVQLEVCGGAAPILLEGRPVRSIEARSGDRFLVGNTLLVVIAHDREPSPTSSRGQADVRTVLGGLGADARAMASVYDLIESLDAAADRASLERALRDWGSLHDLDTSHVRADADERCLLDVEEIEGSAGEGAITVAVPAPSDRRERVHFRAKTDIVGRDTSLRRMLVVAGRLFGSAAARVHQLEVASEEMAALRTMSFGSARAFLGTSPSAERLAAIIPKLAASDVGLLLEGETGVGKTFVARLIHEASPRAHEPLRVLNCAAIPETLIESELFGHERGAFTGAVSARAGAFEAVGRGTLFLDEIGELSLASQAKLLRVLEDRRFERIGSNRVNSLEARVICATNRDLQGMAERGEFRSDLFFRISVVRVEVPALRERGDDLILLAKRLLADQTQSTDRRVVGYHPDTIEAIRRYSWPGNVRELRNAIEHAVALGDGPMIMPADLPPQIASRPAQPDDPTIVRLPMDLARLERRGIEAALRETGGNRVRASALLGINRTTLYHKLKEYQIG